MSKPVEPLKKRICLVCGEWYQPGRPGQPQCSQVGCSAFLEELMTYVMLKDQKES